jgi:heterodisulfide reductase subunit C
MMMLDDKKNSPSAPASNNTRITIGKTKKPPNDMRFKKSGFKKCIQCGRCTGSCPAAFLYPDYNPRELMKHFMFNEIDWPEVKENIWKCGQCYSCRARCPRNCKAGLGVLAIQTESVSDEDAPPELLKLGEDVKKNLYLRGETFLPSTLELDDKTEWMEKRRRLGYPDEDAHQKPVPADAMDEIRKILKLTGFTEGK